MSTEGKAWTLRNEPLVFTLGVRMTNRMFQKLLVRANEAGLSKAEFIRRLLDKALDIQEN